MKGIKSSIVSWRKARAQARAEKFRKREAAHRAKLQEAWRKKVKSAHQE